MPKRSSSKRSGFPCERILFCSLAVALFWLGVREVGRRTIYAPTSAAVAADSPSLRADAAGTGGAGAARAAAPVAAAAPRAPLSVVEAAAASIVQASSAVAAPPRDSTPTVKLLQKRPAPEQDDSTPTKCKRPATFVSLLDPPKAKKIATISGRVDLKTELVGNSFAWCHDGISKNGQFSFEESGFTGGDFPNWGLKRWKVVGPSEVMIDDGGGGNMHRLVFNCQGTGFFVAERGGQRGYLDNGDFFSPDDANAPTSRAKPDCPAAGASSISSSVADPGADAAGTAMFYDSSANGGRWPVWIWWDFPHGVPTSFRMNLRTWRVRIPSSKFDVHLLNQSNIRHFIPGLPDAYFRLYQAAKSDFLRASLLALHGGVYLDGDMLLSSDLDVVVKDLIDGKVDVLPYEGPGDSCSKGTYTTNFMAGAKGNALSSEWIDITISEMYKRCKLPESENYREPVKVCCYQEDWCMRRECHVAWGDISHPPGLSELPKGSVRLDCIPFNKGFSYTMNGQELFFRLVKEKTSKPQHCWLEGEDLMCNGVGRLKSYFHRHGHHLYNMLNGGTLDKLTEEQVMQSDTVVAELYRRALRQQGAGGG